MENSAADSYLHKKFKKQLSIEPKVILQDGGKGIILYREPREEKRPESGDQSQSADDRHHHTRKDNNESVPNQSTNENSSLSSSRISKSSISVEEYIANLQSSCISFVESKNWNEQSKQPSFDTAAVSTTTTSSILDNLYKQNYVNPENVPSNIAKDHEGSAEERTESAPAPDKLAAGKYVCPYCNLVCSKPSVLQKHIRAHTNERPFPCKSCGFSFKTRSNLYKHCRSRTHANRVMGKVQEIHNESQDAPSEAKSPESNDAINEERSDRVPDFKSKPYKPRFHTKQFFKENEENKDEPKSNSNLLSEHINDIISKNNSIVNANDSFLLKKRPGEAFSDIPDQVQHHITDLIYLNNIDEPLNLTKNRKRCMSEVVEPVAQKSLIKELLLKNLNSDMQCLHCKMIFQTVTELELHKLRSCKGFVKPGAKYSRSSSVNVASILTQNKNAFDNIPHLHHAVFPLKSPGPFLGKTRLVESDKSKSFSFDDGLPAASFPPATPTDRYLLSPLTLPNDKEKRTPVKLFGGEVKITHTTGETKSFKIDNKDDKYGGGFVEFGGKVSENRVVKSGLQSGGTVLTNKANYPKEEGLRAGQDVIRVYENTPISLSIDISKSNKPEIQLSHPANDSSVRPQHDHFASAYKYTNIVDFSQKAVKLLTPNLKQPNLAVPGVPVPNKFIFNFSEDLDKPKVDPEPQNLTTQKIFQPKAVPIQPNFNMNNISNVYNPMKLLVNGKVVRYVPGMPGPVAAEEPLDMACGSPIVSTRPAPRTVKPDANKLPPPSPSKSPKTDTLEVKTDFTFKAADLKSPKAADKTEDKKKPTAFGEAKKFARPNSLALKPTTASLKQHHGLTPTMFNQILISPDTPRVAKKYVQQFLHGNYFSYLGLKCSTKPVYCTLNKTQPFYVPHFKKLSMYSEWRQQDTKTEKLFVSAYDSRQKHQKYTMAGKSSDNLVVHSSYKFVVSESSIDDRGEDQQKSGAILGGYECNDDYTYIRGRGRGRYVCDQCGIRCKKPSMLKKHIRTHSNDRPYTCNHCNFSFKTKGNLTKHMKSKAHTKNYAASGSGSSTQQSGTQSSESDTEDSGMDSSDECTRREEHEAAYGLLSLSQKTSQNIRRECNSPISSVGSEPSCNVLNTEEIAHMSKSNYVKNKILDDKTPLTFSAHRDVTTVTTSSDEEVHKLSLFLGKTSLNRPLTYPYTSVFTHEVGEKVADGDKTETKCIKQFHVIQKYAANAVSPNKVREPQRHAADNSGAKRTRVLNSELHAPPPVLKVNDAVVLSDNQSVIAEVRKRKLGYADADFDKPKQLRADEVMDLSMPTEKASEVRYNGAPHPDAYSVIKKKEDNAKHNDNFVVVAPINVNINYVMQEPQNCDSPKSIEYDNSAMETLADIATKQVKLEKNTLAKSVASEFLKLATQNEFAIGDVSRDPHAVPKEVNDLLVKPEGNKNCHICDKSFSKAPQLRLHMNIHYLERPFRCHSCSVSFRTKGHLQKHERSASHHNKLSSSPALSSSEPRPFKCVDCNIAFRIHGHLAKHLRSKMHIMKLECLAKIPFGLYAELERSNSLLTEINTADGDQCLESLKTLAKKVFINDPNKLNQLNSVESVDADS